jgi:molybdenum-dependent DNA-binding transcriptional regulator ModE
MKSVEQQVEDMIRLLNENLVDAQKHGKGNAAAGGRIRKMLQEVTANCKSLRKQVQEERKSG